MDLWKQSIVIVDEYDWILFEGKSKDMVKVAELYQKAYKLVGLTGSTLTIKEESVLNFGLQSGIVKFPTLSSLAIDKKVHLLDHMINSNQVEFGDRLAAIVGEQCAQTPGGYSPWTTSIVLGLLQQSLDSPIVVGLH